MKDHRKLLLLLIIVLCCALSLSVATSVTRAKYADQRKAYTDFRAAEFNAAILLNEPGQGTQTRAQAGYQVALTQLRPGLVKENGTAIRIPFYVSNGPNAANTAQVPLKYTVQVRTARNLPLAFSLESEKTAGGEMTLYSAGNPVLAQNMPEGSQPLYEYSFFMESEAQAKDATDPTQATEDTDATDPTASTTPPVILTKAEFTLEPDPAGSFCHNFHNIVVEWPVSQQALDLQYIKEVEILEILVTVHSLNQTGQSTAIVTPVTEGYTPGVVILTEETARQDYSIDLKAFYPDEEELLQFVFTVNNGTGFQKPTDKDFVNYTIGLRVPVTKTADGYEDLKLAYAMDDPQNPIQNPSYYWILNEVTGETRKNEAQSPNYATLEQVVQELKKVELEPEEWIYGIYPGLLSDTLQNFEKDDTTSLKTAVPAQKEHRIILTGDDAATIETTDISFHSKLVLMISAEFTDETQETQP